MFIAIVLFKSLNPKIFLQRFMEWTQLDSDLMEDENEAIDGKTMRGSYDKATGKKALN